MAEFAVETFQTPLVVVLGHTGCGAVAATLNQIRQPQASRSQHLHSIVERIRPAVEPLLEIRTDLTHEHLLERAIRSNVRMSVNHLRYGSCFLEEIHDSGSLWIVGAEYSLESGEVDFFEDLDKEKPEYAIVNTGIVEPPEFFKQAIEKCEVGGVMMNNIPGFRIDHMPYGGVKDSGLGREGLTYAMDEMTEGRLIVF